MVRLVALALTAVITIASALPAEAAKCKIAKVLNRGFESGSAAHWTTGGDQGYVPAVITPGAKKSDYAFRMTVPPASGGFSSFAEIFQAYSWCTGTTYSVSFDIKSSGQPILFVYSDYGGSNTIYSNFQAFSTSYQHIVTSFTAPSNAVAINFEMFNPSEGGSVDVYIDNVKIVKA